MTKRAWINTEEFNGKKAKKFKAEAKSGYDAYGHDKKGRLIISIYHNPNKALNFVHIVTDFPFTVSRVYKSDGVWFLDVEFEDLGGEKKEVTIPRYDLATYSHVMSKLYMGGMPDPNNVDYLIDYLRASCPKKETKKEEKDDKKTETDSD